MSRRESRAMGLTRLLAAAALAASVACGGADKVVAPTAAGVFSLQTLNGQTLPYAFADDTTAKQELVSSELTLDADGNYHEITQIRTTQGTAVTNASVTETGTYAFSGTTLTFHILNDGTYAGTLNGATLITTDGPDTYSYTRK